MSRPRERTRIDNTYYKQSTLTESSSDGSDFYQVSYYEDAIPLSPRGEITTDVVGNRNDDNPFTSDKWNRNVCSYSSSLTQRWMQEEEGPGGPTLIERKTRTTSTGFMEIPFLAYELVESDQEFVTRAYAGTNPSKADFDAPVFLAELRDVPGLLKNAATKLSKFGASEYLKFEYGWKPLVSDMRKLVKTMDRLERRLATLRNLRDNHSIRRRYTPPDRIEAFVNTEVLADYSAPNAPWLQPRVTARAQIERWCVCEWIADVDPNQVPATDQQLMDTAKRAAFGGTVDGSTLWELMPWSWLIDWNTNLSEYISSQRNIVGAKPGKSCLMKQTTLSATGFLEVNTSSVPDFYEHTSQSSGGSSTAIIKERIIGIEPQAISTGEINLLGGDLRKQSILGALGVQRLRRLPI